MAQYKQLQRRRIIGTVKDVDYLLSLIKKYGLTVVELGNGSRYKTLNQWKATHNYRGLSDSIIIDYKDTKLEITTRYAKQELCKACTYVFDLNEDAIFAVKGLTTFTQLQRYYKIPDASDYNIPEFNKESDRYWDSEKKHYCCSARPILMKNDKYENKELTNCYEYDINSAYFNILTGKIPDLQKGPVVVNGGKVKKNQVGFILNDELKLVDQVGGRADVIFNLIDCPEGYRKYYEKYYELKKNSTGLEKQKWKAYLNLPIGYSQKYNPFLRAYVVHKCNNLIKGLIDDNTLFCNTDAIFSLVKRDDIELGLEIGQFKEIYANKLCYNGFNYQIDDDIPIFRGINKNWFINFEKINGRKFNLLIDEPPKQMNKWSWNWKELKLVENIYE